LVGRRRWIWEILGIRIEGIALYQWRDGVIEGCAWDRMKKNGLELDEGECSVLDEEGIWNRDLDLSKGE